MRSIKTILRLHFEGGLSRRQIALSQDIGYGTVANYLTRAKQAGVGWPLPPDMRERDLAAKLFPPSTAHKSDGLAEPDFPKLQHDLKLKGVTKLLAWEEYREVHPEDGYSYSQYCARYHNWLGLQARSMRQVHIAGEKCFVDYAGQRVPIVNMMTGEVSFAQIFVAVLGASGLAFVQGSASQTEPDWIASHNAALGYFGGASEIYVPDNGEVGRDNTRALGVAH